MKLRLFCVCDAFIATQSHVCLNVKTSRRLLSIEISLCSVFAVLAFVLRLLFSRRTCSVKTRRRKIVNEIVSFFIQSEMRYRVLN